MENTDWIQTLMGRKRVFNNKIEFEHHLGQTVVFDSEEELNEYLQEYFLNMCDLSSNS